MNDYRWILLLAFIVLFDGTLIWFSNPKSEQLANRRRS